MTYGAKLIRRLFFFTGDDDSEERFKACVITLSFVHEDRHFLCTRWFGLATTSLQPLSWLDLLFFVESLETSVSLASSKLALQIGRRLRQALRYPFSNPETKNISLSLGSQEKQ